MFSYIKIFLSNMFGKNTTIYEKPLNTLSIILVIAFDIFLFYNILSWYNYQKDLVVSPYEKYSCINYFYDNNNSLLNQIGYYYQNDQFVGIDMYWNKETVNYDWDICKTLNSKIEKFKQTQEYISFKSELDSKESEISSLNSQKYQYESQYNDFLEESKAWIVDENSRLSDINKENARRDYNNIKDQINLATLKKDELVNNFLATNSDFKDLSDYINQNKESFLKNYDKEIFWYPVKITGFQTLLLLPLFLISLFFYKLFLRRQNKIFTILFSNLTFITWIFVFVLFLKVVYFILPKKFFASLIALLKSLSLWFLWNYILVIIWVWVFGFVIYLSQKWIDKIQKIKEEQEKLRIEQNKKKVQVERFGKWLCLECNSKLLSDSRYCQVCWEDQFYECNKCKNLIPKVFEYCNKCWNNNK